MKTVHEEEKEEERQTHTHNNAKERLQQANNEKLKKSKRK